MLVPPTEGNPIMSRPLSYALTLIGGAALGSAGFAVAAQATGYEFKNGDRAYMPARSPRRRWSSRSSAVDT